jgi:hypothetical protein
MVAAGLEEVTSMLTVIEPPAVGVSVDGTIADVVGLFDTVRVTDDDVDVA